MKYLRFTFVALVFSLLFSTIPTGLVHAQISTNGETGKAIIDQLQQGARETQLTATQTPQELISSYVQIGLGFVGTFFLLLVLFGGYTIFVSKGDESRYQKGKDTIRMAIIGLAVVLLAYSITLVIAQLVTDAATSQVAPMGSRGDASDFDDFAEFFGNNEANVQ